MIVPRYEFRAFSQKFGWVADTIRRLSPHSQITESAEIYLVSEHDRYHNVKVRNNRLEIIRLLEVSGELELWEPICKRAFPIPREIVNSELLPALGVPRASFAVVLTCTAFADQWMTVTDSGASTCKAQLTRCNS